MVGPGLVPADGISRSVNRSGPLARQAAAWMAASVVVPYAN